jgi:hypothetical protein
MADAIAGAGKTIQTSNPTGKETRKTKSLLRKKQIALRLRLTQLIAEMT